MTKISDIRPSPLAGRWYPADPERLARQVDEYIRRAALPRLEGDVVAIIVPHAGLQYSGPVAGHAFAALRGMNPDIVAVISPMHAPEPARLLTTAHTAYQTPLGDVPVAREAVELLDNGLRQALQFGLTPIAYDDEHSLEIELPFLQRVLEKPFALLPVMVRDQQEQTARGLGRELARLAGGLQLSGRSLLLVASTDLSHFYPQAMANALDREMLRRVESFDPNGVLRAEQDGVGFACGRAGLAAVLWAAQELGANQVKIVRHATSGDVTGDYDRVVGYGAAVVLKTS